LSLLIVGSVALDTIYTPQGEIHDALGGSAIYGALSASHFCPVSIVGVVGKDFPLEGMKLLTDNGIDTSGLEIVNGKTFRWSGRYNNWNKAETLSTELNVFAEFSPHLPDNCKCCNSVLLGNIHPTLQLQVLSQISAYSHLACDTMNYWINLCPDELAKVIGKVDIVFMNEDEVKDWTGRKDVFSAARAILATGPKWVIVKRGEYGSVAISEEHLFFSPAYPVENVVDPTGAGDCYAGAFMAYLANYPSLTPQNIRTAVRYGTVLSARNVQNFSVKGLIGISKTEIETDKEKLIEWTT